MNSRLGEPERDRLDDRRISMRRELLDHLRTHHRRRQTRRRALSVAGLLLVASVLLVLVRPQRPDQPLQVAVDRDALGIPDASTVPLEPAHRSVVIEVVSTRTSITDDYVRTPPTLVQCIDDRSLLENLVAMNRPAGLIRSGDNVWLSRPVTDPIEP